MHSQAQSQRAVAQPAATQPTVVLPGPGGGTTVIPSPPVALSARDVAVIKARREELSSQLQSVDSRRGRLLTQLKQVGDETAKKGLEDRIALLDQRQLQLENDIAETGRQLSSVPAGLLATTQRHDNIFQNVKSMAPTILGGLFIIFVLAPLALSAAKRNLRRFGGGASPGLSADASQRLERIEQSIDAIALEIERVSEGQRFVTRLLSESQHFPAVGAGRVGEPVRANQ